MNHIEHPIQVMQPDDRQIVVTSDHGHAHAAFDGNTVLITDLYVHPGNRRQGLGSAMLWGILTASERAGATRVAAELSSRPSVDAALRVFGPDAIEILAASEYDAEGDLTNTVPPAVAYLNYRIPKAPDPGGAWE